MRWVAAASLAVNLAFALVCVSRQIRRQVPDVPSRGQARAALFRELAAGPSAHRDVVVLGDSLTERGEWWELLDRPVANRGIAGDTVENVRARLDDIIALEPRVLFVLVGVNDLLAGASPELLASRHTQLVVELRRRMPRTRVVVSSGTIRWDLTGVCQTQIASYSFPSTAVAVVVVEWTKPLGGKLGRLGRRPRHFTAANLPLRRAPAVECFSGPGGSAQWSERGHDFAAYVLLGRKAPARLAASARAVLDTLRVAPR